MFEFLKILLISSIAGFVAVSLMWISFWFFGIFETPATVRRLLGILRIVRNNQFQEASAPLNGGLESQAAAAAIPNMFVREDGDNLLGGAEIVWEPNSTTAASDKENSNYYASSKT
jgi:hypothetical protein